MSIDSSTALAPAHDLAVDRQALAGANDDDVAAPDVLDGHVDLRAVALDARRLRLQRSEPRSAVAVWRFARASSALPVRMSAMMMITAS